jgi:hypothetical protein
MMVTSDFDSPNSKIIPEDLSLMYSVTGRPSRQNAAKAKKKYEDQQAEDIESAQEKL